MKFRFLFGVMMVLCLQKASYAASAIVGYSIATGAVAHERVGYDANGLNQIFRASPPLSVTPEAGELLKQRGLGPAADFQKPVRLWPTLSEYNGGIHWVITHLFGVASRQYLDMEEYGWGYLVGRMLGYSGDEILIAAEDGARSKVIRYQFNRVLEHTKGILPEHIFMMFTGNDLCGINMSLVTDAQSYAHHFDQQIRYLASVAKLSATESHIWLVDPVGVAQLSLSEALLAKKVKAHGKEMTCGELYSVNRGEKMSSEEVHLMFLPKSPSAYCSTLLVNKNQEDAERIGKLANLIRSYRENLQKAVEGINKDKEKGRFPASISVHHISETSNYIIEPEDLANDCFHLSLQGQAKLARSILKGVESRLGVSF